MYLILRLTTAPLHQSLVPHSTPAVIAFPLSQVYVHYNELTNFFKAVASLLALPDDAGPTAAMAAISNVVQQAAK